MPLIFLVKMHAKVTHAVLLCDMERGVITWDNSEKNDWIRRAHDQRHSQNSKSWAKPLNKEI